MKSTKKLFCTVVVFSIILASVSYARQSQNYDFSLWFNSGDETKSDMATSEAYRFEEEVIDPYARVYVSPSSSNFSNSVRMKVQNLRASGGVNEDASSGYVLLSGSGNYTINYKSKYAYLASYYRLYGWTIKNDCTVTGTWSP